jgi:hypothetical protein
VPECCFEPGRIGGWLDKIRRTPKVYVGQDAAASPSARHDCWVVAPVRARNAGIAALGAARSGRPFSTPDVKLSLAIAEQAGALIENAFAHRDKLADAARATEMLLAAQVQHDLLPRTRPPLPGIQVHAARTRPRRSAATSTTCCRSARTASSPAWGTCRARASPRPS